MSAAPRFAIYRASGAHYARHPVVQPRAAGVARRIVLPALCVAPRAELGVHMCCMCEFPRSATTVDTARMSPTRGWGGCQLSVLGHG